MADSYAGKGSALPSPQPPPTNTLHTFGYDAEGKIVLRAARTSFNPSRDHFVTAAALMLREAVVVRKQTNIDPFVLWDHIMGNKWVVQPIDMILYCPNCGKQHIDEEDPLLDLLRAAGVTCSPSMQDPDELVWSDGIQRPYPWNNPPHRTHLCQDPECGMTWRPADVPTNGVASIKTEGKNDRWVVYPGEIDAAPATKEPS